jgi:hypothetical protein
MNIAMIQNQINKLTFQRASVVSDIDIFNPGSHNDALIDLSDSLKSKIDGLIRTLLVRSEAKQINDKGGI